MTLNILSFLEIYYTVSVRAPGNNKAHSNEKTENSLINMSFTKYNKEAIYKPHFTND